MPIVDKFVDFLNFIQVKCHGFLADTAYASMTPMTTVMCPLFLLVLSHTSQRRTCCLTFATMYNNVGAKY